MPYLVLYFTMKQIFHDLLERTSKSKGGSFFFMGGHLIIILSFTKPPYRRCSLKLKKGGKLLNILLGGHFL